VDHRVRIYQGLGNYLISSFVVSFASMRPADILPLYAGFDAPLAELDCGQKCAPYNGGMPFCCDIHHTVPTAYPAEWIHLQSSTDLWQVWQPDNEGHRDQLQTEAGNLILLECQMLTQSQHSERTCRRDLRTFVCRAFPFFPYFNSQGELLGLSVYWEYADRCWVISNLHIVRHEFRTQFIDTYETLFTHIPDERAAYQYFSSEMRQEFQSRRRTIPLLHRDGRAYKISPATERIRSVEPDSFPKYGPYKIADMLAFPDE
jgi:hypothetical protein